MIVTEVNVKTIRENKSEISSGGSQLKIFKYEIELTDDNDKDYYKTGIIISDSKETAQEEVYEYYDSRTTDYVSHNVLLNEINVEKSMIIED